MDIDLEIDKAVSKIKSSDAKIVCIQLPDGLKPIADKIQQELQEQTHAKVVIWAGSCYGSCDIPMDLERLGMDLLIQWGHSAWA